MAIEALKERETLEELAKRFGVSAVMISRWKKEFLANSAAAFEKDEKSDREREKERNRMLAKIGELELEVDFCKRASRILGIEVPAKR